MTRFSFYDHDATQSEWAHRLCLSSVHYCEDHFHIHNIHSNTVISNQISTGCGHKIFFDQSITLADPDLDMGGGGKGVFCRLPCRLFFLLRFFFITQNIEEGEGGGPGPSPRSAAEFSKHRGKRRFAANDTLSCQVKAFSIQGKNLQLLVSWHQHQIPQRGYWDSNNLFFLGFPLDNQKSHEEKYNLANSHHVVIILHGPAKVEITLFQHGHQESTKKNQFELTLQQN